MMPYGLMDGIPSEDDSIALDFRNASRSIPVKDLEISNKSVTSPFIIQLSYKLYESTPSFMFSLEDKKNRPLLALKISDVPEDPGVVKTSLLRRKTDLPIDFYSDKPDDYINVLFFVKDDKVEMCMECQCMESQPADPTTIFFDESSNFIIGKAKAYDVDRTFPVSPMVN